MICLSDWWKGGRGPELGTPGKHSGCMADPIWAQVSSCPKEDSSSVGEWEQQITNI